MRNQVLSEIFGRYDVYLVDMWGTIYDRGVGLYPKAAACLRELKRAGKTVILTSNAARPASLELTRQLGSAALQLCYDHLVTAGEVLRQMTLEEAGIGRGLGMQYYMLGHERNRGLLTDLGFTEVPDPRNANFIVVAGLLHPDDATSYEHPVYQETEILLGEALGRRTPLFVAKSDWLTVFPDGSPWIGPGKLMQWYLDRGGIAHFVGKPARAYYEYCERYFTATPGRVLAIGDHGATDIAGARSHGFDTLLVRSGIESRLTSLPHLIRGKAAAIPTYETQVLEW